MSFDTVPGENESALRRAWTAAPEEPGPMGGLGKAIGMGLMRGGANLARSAAIGIGTPIAQEVGRIYGRGDPYAMQDAGDAWFSYLDRVDLPGYWTPQPGEVGAASEVIGGLAELVLPLAATKGRFAGLAPQAAIGEPATLIREGVDQKVARQVGMQQMLGLAAGFAIPGLGSTLSQKMVYGAGGNLVQGVATRAVSHETLRAAGYGEAAEKFDPASLTAAFVDLGAGAIFGAVQRGVEVLGAKGAQKVVRISDAPPELIDALNVLAAAKQMERAAPATPADEATLTNHIEALSYAVSQAIKGIPVDMTPFLDPIRQRWLEAPEIERRAQVDIEDAVKLAQLAPVLDEILTRAGVRKPGFDGALRAIGETVSGLWQEAPVKSVGRASEKTLYENFGDATRLKDALRGTLQVDSPERGASALASIRERFEIVGPVRDWLNGPPDAGNYRDIKVNVLVDGVVAEVQINLPEMLEAKAAGHGYYEIMRRIDADAAKYGKGTVPAEEWQLYAEARDAMDALYAKAWEKAQARLARERQTGSDTLTPLRNVPSKGKGLGPGESQATGLMPGETTTGIPSTSQKSDSGGNASGSGSRAMATSIAGNDSTVTTARGDVFAVRYRVVEARDLRASHADDLTVNPDYPPELQPRDRARAASEVQVAKIAEALDPQQLLDSRLASTGAPIVGGDLAVESGNARTIALRRAYAAGKAEGYRAVLVGAAERLGLDPAAVAGMEAPVLVRERITPTDRATFAVDANEAPTQQMSVTEQARADARRLASLDGLATNDRGEILEGPSRSLIRRFMDAVVGPNEANRMLSRDGQGLSQTGLKRLRDAVFAFAYDDADVIYRAAESADPEVRNVLGGMMRAAPDVAAVRDGIRSGDLYDVDVSQDVALAARKLAQLKEDGISVADWAAQGELVPDPNMTEGARALVVAFAENARSAARIADIITTATKTVEALGNPKQESLLGGTLVPDRADVITDAVERVAARNAPPEARKPTAPEPTQDPVSQAALEAAKYIAKFPNLRIIDDQGNVVMAQDAARAAAEGKADAEAKRAAIDVIARTLEKMPPERVAELAREYTLRAERNRVADEAPGADPVRPGQKFLVYRLDDAPGLANRNAANADGLAYYLDRVDDPGSPMSSSAKTVRVYEVTVDDDFTGYAALRKGKAGEVPQAADRVGRQVRDTDYVWYSFGESGYQSREVGAFTLEQIRDAFTARHGADTVDDLGTQAAAEVLRDLATPAAVRSEAAVYGPRSQMWLDFEAAPTAVEKTKALGRIVGNVIARQFAKKFEVGEANALIGQKVTTPQDLAILAQIYRSPQYETLRYFFTKGDEIIGSTAVSARHPTSASAFVDKGAGPKTMQDLRMKMVAIGADGVWLLHNHPSGDPTPSHADMRMTEFFTKGIPEIKGHVVIDHGKFTFMEGTYSQRWAIVDTRTGRPFELYPSLSRADRAHKKMPAAERGYYEVKEHSQLSGVRSYTRALPAGSWRDLHSPHVAVKPHPALGRKIVGSEDLARIMREFGTDPNVAILFGTDAHLKVVAMEEVPTGQINAEASDRRQFNVRMLAEARKRMLQWGAVNLYMVGDLDRGRMATAIAEGILDDAITTRGNSIRIKTRDGELRPHTIRELDYVSRGPDIFRRNKTVTVESPIERYDAQAAAEIERILGRPLSDEEMTGILGTIRGEARRMSQGGGQSRIPAGPPGSETQRISSTVVEAARLTAEKAARDAALREHRTNLSIIRSSERLQDLAKGVAGGKHGYVGTVARMIAEHGDQGNIFSTEARYKGIFREARMNLVDAWDALGDDWWGFIQDPAKIDVLVREMKGENTGDALARKGAEAWRRTTEDLRTRLNAAGGDIGHLEDWGFPQHHSQRKVSRAGVDAWVAFVKPRLDVARYKHLDGSQMTGGEIDDFLRSSWETIASDGVSKLEPGQYREGGGRANRHSASREIHLKDAAASIEYWQTFGDAPFSQILLGHVNSMARDIAFLETFGPKPDATYQLLRDLAYKAEAKADPAGLDKVRSRMQGLDQLYDYAAGKSSTFSDGALARGFDAVRNLNVAGKLGSAVWTSFFGDKATYELMSHINNVPMMQRWYNEVRLLNPANAAERNQLRRMGLFLDYFSDQANRFAGDLVSNTWTGRLASGVMKISGMNAINDWRRGAFGLGMMDAIGTEIAAGKNFADLDASDVRLLKAHGIDERTWRVWQLAQLADVGGGNRNVLTPEAIAKIDPSTWPADLGNPRVAKREAVTKLLGAIEAETDLAVIMPGWRERAWVEGGVARNTWKGEISRSFWQFKTFPLAQFWRHWDVASTMGSGAARAAYMGSLIAMQTVLGGMLLTVAEILAGRDPRPADDPRFWIAAALKGGAAGIYGDFLYAETTRYGMGPLEAVAGPTIGTAADMSVSLQRNFAKAMKGDETNLSGDATRVVKGFVPGANLWYTRAATDHLIFHNLQETMNPGALARMRQRAWSEYRQQWYWQPGEALPERAPDLSKVMGQ